MRRIQRQYQCYSKSIKNGDGRSTRVRLTTAEAAKRKPSTNPNDRQNPKSSKTTFVFPMRKNRRKIRIRLKERWDDPVAHAENDIGVARQEVPLGEVDAPNHPHLEKPQDRLHFLLLLLWLISLVDYYYLYERRAVDRVAGGSDFD